MVELPWKCAPEILPDNYSIAKRRLGSLYSRLSKHPERLKEYDNIIRTQEAEGIIERIDPDDMTEVYAANAKRIGKPSLNDCLETGPNFLPKLFDILVRFRAYKYAITSDVKAAFLNIGIDEKD